MHERCVEVMHEVMQKQTVQGNKCYFFFAHSCFAVTMNILDKQGKLNFSVSPSHILTTLVIVNCYQAKKGLGILIDNHFL